jgi:hypothetical protein
MVMSFCSVKLLLNYSVWKNKPTRPQDNITGLPQTTGTPATGAQLPHTMPLTTQALEILPADMVKDKTTETILQEICLVNSHSKSVIMVLTMVARLAVIKLVAEDMVVDRMIEAVVVAEHPTLEEPIPFPEILMLHVMDVAKTIMSWPVQPLQPNENGLC